MAFTRLKCGICLIQLWETHHLLVAKASSVCMKYMMRLGDSDHLFQRYATKDNSKENLYIESLRMNGKESSRNYLKHDDLLKGGILEFKMGSQPNLNRGISEEDAPYSFSKEK